MRKTFNTVFRLLVVRFYKLNAGFFLFLFVLLFGVVNPPIIISYHLALINGIIQVPVFMTIVMVIWFFYNLKCIFFCIRTVETDTSNLLFNLQAIDTWKQVLILFGCHFLLYFPIFAYVLIILKVAVQQANAPAVISLLIFHSLMYIMATYVYYRKLNFPFNEWALASQLNNITRLSMRKSIYFYLFYYTLDSLKVGFLVLKVVSLFLLGVMLVMNSDKFQVRNFIIFFLLIILIHAIIVYNYVGFIEKKLSFIKNLPLSVWKYLNIYAITYCLILLPELIYIIINGQNLISLNNIFLFYGIGVGQLVLYTAVLYASSFRMKPYVKIILVIYLSSSVLLLSEQYFLFFSFQLTIAVLLFVTHYYRFELNDK